MSGKAYTMREMRNIVEYLTQHRAYSEIKGRKMWMNFASSQMTTRTWQSLKETFLKRILPDIHNPYYQLTMEQIRSFREGYDVQDRANNKLEIHTISDDSSSNNAENESEKDNAQPSTSNNDNEDKTSGEKIKCSQITSRNSSSADTYVLEKCYETAEEIQRDLESPKLNKIVSKENEVSDNVTKSTAKSLRDFITYSEPLTPMLQELLDDFASEDESDREPRMEIAEDVIPDNDSQSIIDKPSNTPTDAPNSDSVATSKDAKHPSPSKSTTVEEPLNEKADIQQPCTEASKNTENDVSENNIVSADTSKQGEKDVTVENMPNPKPQENETQTIVINDSEDSIVPQSKDPHVSDPDALKKTGDMVSKTNENSTQNCSHTTNDSVLPNNPEAFDKSPIINKQTLKENGNTEGLPDTTIDENIATRKRSNSKDDDCPESKKSKQGSDNIKPIEGIQEQASSITEINTVTRNSVSNENTDIHLKQSSTIEEIAKAVPSTSNVDKPKTIDDNELVAHVSDDDDDEEIINPCLKSVSLYAEQFNTLKYGDTDSDAEDAVANSPVDENKQDKIKDVVILKSHSESETDHNEAPVKKTKAPTCVSTKVKRDRALANIFGFSTGGITKHRKRHSSCKKSTERHYDRTNSFDSSEWTSESDSEAYVSPPRGRKNRHTRKYLKPQFSRLLSLEEDGGLFVMNGKKIYPLIKDGRTVKNYLTYLPDSDKEEDDYWKLKYVEERKRTEELKKLLEQFKKEQIRESKSPILQQATSRNPTGNLKTQSTLNITTNNDEVPVLAEPKPEVEHKQENVKLKFTINNEEVQLEGQWSNINPVLEKVMQVFNSNNNKVTHAIDPKSKAVQAELKPAMSHSGSSTPIVVSPVDIELREKIDQIENEIFKEIEERDKEETNDGEATKPLNGEESKSVNGEESKSVNGEESKSVDGQEENVTRRTKPMPSETSVPSSNSPAEQKQTPKVAESKESVKSAKKRRITELETIISPKRQTKTPKKLLNESSKNETRSLRTRKSKEAASSTFVVEDEPNVLYKFPTKKNSRVSASKSEKIKEKKSNKSKENPKTVISPDSLSRNSIESTQGYQDSDTSPIMDTQIRRKKRLSLTLQYRSRQQFHRNIRRRSTSCLPHFLSSYSSTSSICAPVRKDTHVNSSLNTEEYRSESYQLLLQQPKLCIKRLEIIDETSPASNVKINKQLFTSMNTDINENITKMNNDTIDSNQGSMEAGSSSNVSLPLSPELSIVENLSLSKDMMTCIVEDPTINETQANDIPDLESYQQYLISEIDISVPLMEQECGLEVTTNNRQTNNNLCDPKGTAVSDSLLNKIGTVKINENSTLLHSLDQKLQDLLIESAKKISPASDLQNKNSPMEVDVSTGKVTVKANAKKRCSTPRKKNGTNKSKPPKIGPVIEEEHMEFCSHSGRKSCPPHIDIRPIEETANFDETLFDQTNMQITAPDKPTKKKKKDIIKVKILRPRDKNHTKGNNEKKKTSEDNTKLSVNTDSGINDTGLGISATMLSDSVDLIHNHSETCLQAHECVDHSVEFIENSSPSIISIDSNSMQTGENLWQNIFNQFNDAQDIPPDTIFNNAQDSTNFNKETGIDSPDTRFDTPCETVYHSPLVTENTSLLTEDLSDEIPSNNSHPEEPTKWYLLSDDETNTMGLQFPNADFTSSGANLNDLFPVACAIPDLSTITEMSRENDDNSRKPTFKDEDTKNDFDTVSIFENVTKCE